MINKQDDIHCQGPTPPPMAFSVPNRNVLYLRETKLWRCERRRRGGRGENVHLKTHAPLGGHVGKNTICACNCIQKMNEHICHVKHKKQIKQYLQFNVLSVSLSLHPAGLSRIRREGTTRPSIGTLQLYTQLSYCIVQYCTLQLNTKLYYCIVQYILYYAIIHLVILLCSVVYYCTL